MPAHDLTVAADTPPRRLDRFARAALVGASRLLVARLIAEGAIRVNGRPARKGDLVRPGDRIAIPDLPDVAPNARLACRVVYADTRILALDKPSGIPSVPLDPRERDTAANFLLAQEPALRGVGDPLACGLAHRLDTGTSGLLVAARDAETYGALRAAFREGRVRKRYLTIVQGRVAARLVMAAPLSHVPADRGCMRPALPGDRAWPARTAVTPLRSLDGATLVCAVIRTGVTHQVRVHLAHAGHPVLGDARYGGPSTELPAGHHALHAAELHLPSGPSGAVPAGWRLGAAMPAALVRLLEALDPRPR
jgi:23S rRNA pseudouridine1911/1915/1917 synthase